ncbi:MAG: ATPase [Candidatus Hydrogenedentes bacterium]|nr:ATPase [Candidatus Hydrogenedentota bacterium]
MQYFLGLDVGGTKTHCLIGDEKGHVLGFGSAGTGNYEVHGVGPALAENKKAINAALYDAGLTLSAIGGIGMGIAGADIPEDYVMLEREVYTPLFGDIPRDFQNDSMAGLRGGTQSPYGIVIACGTGCVCAGKNKSGDHARAGGLGEEFGDECTGSQIGRDGLQRVWQARDGIISPTLLTDKFIQRAGTRDVEELFIKMYRQQVTYTDLQPMAKLVFEAASEGDAASAEILRRGGEYLAAMVNAVARRLQMTDDVFDVVMAGSVFKGSSPILKDAMLAEIQSECPHARTAMPMFEPVVGALLMAMELHLEITPEIYENLSTQLLAAETRYHTRFKAK